MYYISNNNIKYYLYMKYKFQNINVITLTNQNPYNDCLLRCVEKHAIIYCAIKIHYTSQLFILVSQK